MPGGGIEPGTAVQQSSALSTKPRHTLNKPRRTLTKPHLTLSLGKGKVGMWQCCEKGKGRPVEREEKGGYVQCCEKGTGKPGVQEGKGGHVTMWWKREREARGSGRERWACDNMVEKGKGGQG